MSENSQAMNYAVTSENSVIRRVKIDLVKNLADISYLTRFQRHGHTTACSKHPESWMTSVDTNTSAKGHSKRDHV